MGIFFQIAFIHAPDTLNKSYQAEAGNQGRAAIGNKGHGDPGERDQLQNAAYDHKGLKTEQNSAAHGQKGVKAPARGHGNGYAAPDQRNIHQKDTDPENQAKLLTDDSKNKVRFK